MLSPFSSPLSPPARVSRPAPRVPWRSLVPLVAVFAHLASGVAGEIVFVGESAPARAWVPVDDSLGDGWTGLEDPANLGDWLAGTTGVGYEAEAGPGYGPLIGLDVRESMEGIRAGCFIRIPFVIEDPAVLAEIGSLILKMRYDDGFVAWVNGVPVAAANAPASRDWQSGAEASHPDDEARVAEAFDVSAAIAALRAGPNVLAIHGLNAGTTSSDFLVLPELVGISRELPELRLVPVAAGFDRPVGIVPAGDASGRLFILEQRGTVRILEDGVPAPGTWLDLRARVLDHDEGGNERGLLGLAVPPGFGEPGRRHVYASYTAAFAGAGIGVGDSVVSRIPIGDDGVPDPAREEIILTVPQPFSNHNGGQITFGPDGMLWIGFGDGGSARDPGDEAQDLGTLLGKMVRLDVEGVPDPGLPYAVPADNPFADTPGARPEIAHFGARNPWRWSFDRRTGDLWIADVGQDAWEEVTRLPAGSPLGRNLGWDFFEGEAETTFSSDPVPPFAQTTGPVFAYGHGLGRSITGGYVYRGNRFPRLRGLYLFGDYQSGRIWATHLHDDDSGAATTLELTDSTHRIASFGEDEAGELHLADLFSGEILRLEDTRDAAWLEVVEATFDPGDGRFAFTWGAAVGERYQVQRSTDLESWIDVGSVVEADEDDAFRLRFEGTVPAGTIPLFYRATVVPAAP